MLSQIQGVQEEVQGGVQLDVLQLPLFLQHGLGGSSVGTPGPFNLGVLDSSLPICVVLPGGLNMSSLSKLSVDSFVFHIKNMNLPLSLGFIILFGEDDDSYWFRDWWSFDSFISRFSLGLKFFSKVAMTFGSIFFFAFGRRFSFGVLSCGGQGVLLLVDLQNLFQRQLVQFCGSALINPGVRPGPVGCEEFRGHAVMSVCGGFV